MGIPAPALLRPERGAHETEAVGQEGAEEGHRARVKDGRVGRTELGVGQADLVDVGHRLSRASGLFQGGDETRQQRHARQFAGLRIDRQGLLDPLQAILQAARHDRRGRQLQGIVGARLLVEQGLEMAGRARPVTEARAGQRADPARIRAHGDIAGGHMRQRRLACLGMPSRFQVRERSSKPRGYRQCRSGFAAQLAQRLAKQLPDQRIDVRVRQAQVLDHGFAPFVHLAFLAKTDMHVGDRDMGVKPAAAVKNHLGVALGPIRR
ncbi:hypothetical protein [Massilia sp. Se16.2.3]|uniref:hypothetical protein n=1 Tax=Massilia sp. Se16.2.3 TaxID=2709303 RepID=UPI0016000F22|nr:hypothetical protein [Massilia sp. Se16.2.3]QNA99669.1 hypothetical protein G4G31_13835 [Massilia sp. Se16.2.3]